MAGASLAPETATSRAAGRGGLVFIGASSAAVLAASLLASFRLAFAEDVPTLLAANGPRVLFGAAVGSLLSLSGALQRLAGPVRPMRELQRLAPSTGAAGGGFVLAIGQLGAAALWRFAVGAVLGALLLGAAARALDRPRRWTNLGVAVVLVLAAGIAALAGNYVGARRDVLAPVVTWLLGDLRGATVVAGLTLLALTAVLLIVGRAAVRQGSPPHLSALAWIAFGLGVGAAGPLAFVVLMVPLAVRAIARGASPAALLGASAAAGAATVAAVDAVPRLLVGGYDFPWNLPAAMLAIPGFLTWNRIRLRREAGPAGRAFEVLEITAIAGLSLGAFLLVLYLTRLIRLLT